jgi:hypothetical protein
MTTPPAPADDWPIEEPDEELPERPDDDGVDDVVAEDGSSTQEVVYTPPDDPSLEPAEKAAVMAQVAEEYRDTGVVTTGDEPQTDRDLQ